MIEPKRIIFRFTPSEEERKGNPVLADEYAIVADRTGLSGVMPYERWGDEWRALTIPKAEGFHAIFARLLTFLPHPLDSIPPYR